MWALENESPFSVDRSWARNVQGEEVLVVAIKGTFVSDQTGQLHMADNQAPVQWVPEFRNPEAPSSLLAETDFVLRKQNTDVLVEGQAQQANGAECCRLTVSLEVAGHLSKRLHIYGPRHWRKQGMSLIPSEPDAFSQIPLIFENAFGGVDLASNETDWDVRNPVGCGFSSNAKFAEGLQLPSIEFVDQTISSWRDRPQPACLGPLAGHWSPRLEHAGTYDEQWQNERHPLLPLDFDPQYFQCAPADQQMNGLARGGEQISITNMCAEGLWQVRIPRVSLWLYTQFGSGRKVRLRPVIHTVRLFPERRTLEVCWHGHLACHSEAYQLQKVVVRHKPRVTIAKQGVVRGAF